MSLAVGQDKWMLEAKLRDPPGRWNRRVAAYAAIERFADEFQRKGNYTSKQAAHMLAIWAGSARVSEDDWTEAMAPSSIADEVPFGNATDQQVVDAINNCIAHFAAVKATGLQ